MLNAAHERLCAFNDGLAIDAYSVPLEQVYLRRMVELGTPQLAESQAKDLVERDEQDGLAWAVLAYVSGTRGETEQALEYGMIKGMIQAYAEPFVSKGRYSDVRELADPRATRYPDRYRPYDDPAANANPGAFNVKQFNSNVVLRWEYRPGSALFLVWQQGRQDSESQYGTRSLGGDFDRLFSAHPNNTFLVKVSYWLDR